MHFGSLYLSNWKKYYSIECSRSSLYCSSTIYISQKYNSKGIKFWIVIFSGKLAYLKQYFSPNLFEYSKYSMEQMQEIVDKFLIRMNKLSLFC